MSTQNAPAAAPANAGAAGGAEEESPFKKFFAIAQVSMMAGLIHLVHAGVADPCAFACPRVFASPPRPSIPNGCNMLLTDDGLAGCGRGGILVANAADLRCYASRYVVYHRTQQCRRVYQPSLFLGLF